MSRYGLGKDVVIEGAAFCRRRVIELDRNMNGMSGPSLDRVIRGQNSL